MATEMCPACRAIRNLRVTSTTRTVVGPDGKRRLIRTNSYHCGTCGQFVRSEEHEEGEAEEVAGS